MFRLDAEPIDCPLQGPFTFSYDRGYGECRYPESNLDSCTQTSRLLFNYQACPDVPKTESVGECPCTLIASYFSLLFSPKIVT